MERTPVTLAAALASFKNKETKPSDAAAEMLSRIHENDPAIHAYLNVFDEEVMTAAKKADAAYAAGTARPLEGALIAVKDNLLVTGTVTTAGSLMLEKYVAPYTATAVQKLFDAGAIMIGKTNLDEFAMGSSTENSAFDSTRNPRDTSRVPGGSSGGSAAAVAADMCHAALGSDTGGSIRQPASLTGCVGFKPTYGSVSRYGLMSMASSLDVIGSFGNTVEDARILFNVIRGADKRDGTSWNIPDEKKLPTAGSLKGVRIGVPSEYFLPGMDTGVEGCIQNALKKLKSLGAELVDVSLPHTEYGLATYYVIMPAEASTNLSRYDGVRFGTSAMPKASNLTEGYVQSRSHFGTEVQRRILLGTYVLSAGYYDAYYRQAQKMRSLIQKDFTEAFNNVDCIVAPTSPTVAWEKGAKVNDPFAMYLSDVFTVTANLAGIPGISVPCGTSDDLPVGLQLFAAKGNDLFLLDVAETFEKN